MLFLNLFLVYCTLIRTFAPAKVQTFKSQHIHDSEAMKERGIHCVMDQDREMRRKSEFAVEEKSL